eukprot:Blabericola_migrator_1__2816@NODE_1805_length_3768_cov_171_635774_g1162_i0_p4_GENE_NODE_1805_length_3768_cov_171_635774_g1162_i0NODE_1805_length_3768_cov_171_635774_g1162_i0_p4_ORF_typecomplete_len141_score13_25_NODE_1805_length_3768_cov_171_635774_g1162_i0529951
MCRPLKCLCRTLIHRTNQEAFSKDHPDPKLYKPIMLPAIIGIHRKAPCLIARLPVRSFVLTRQPFIPPLPKTKPSFIKTRSFGATLDARQKEMDLESSSQGAAKLDLKYNESANKLLGDICDYLEKTAVPGLSNVELQDG